MAGEPCEGATNQGLPAQRFTEPTAPGPGSRRLLAMTNLGAHPPFLPPHLPPTAATPTTHQAPPVSTRELPIRTCDAENTNQGEKSILKDRHRLTSPSRSRRAASPGFPADAPPLTSFSSPSSPSSPPPAPPPPGTPPASATSASGRRSGATDEYQQTPTRPGPFLFITPPLGRLLKNSLASQRL
jgi:hypothetical protein